MVDLQKKYAQRSGSANMEMVTFGLVKPRWCKPNKSFTKLNVDAVFFPDEGVGATAAILRDDRGNFLAARCKFISFAAAVITIDVMAMRDGLALANSRHAREKEGKKLRENKKGKERN